MLMLVIMALAAIVSIMVLAKPLMERINQAYGFEPHQYNSADQFVNTDWVLYIGISASILYAILYVLKYNKTVGDKFALLQGAAWDLIFLMEASGPGGAESRAEKAEKTVERFAVNGAERVMGRPLAAWQQIDPKLTDAGLELAKIYKADSSSYRQGRQAVRRAIFIFLAIIRDQNIRAARQMILDYNRRKNADWPSLYHLEEFLDIQAGEPVEQTYFQHATSISAIRKAKASLMKGQNYLTPSISGRDPIEISGKDIFGAMREFTRTDDTGRAARD